METKLTDLPKDMLVQLVATIREDVMKEYFNQKEEIQNLKDILNDALRIASLAVERCHIQGCKKYWIRNRELGYSYYSKPDFFTCKKCWNIFCDDHLEEIGTSLCCKKCEFENYN